MKNSIFLLTTLLLFCGEVVAQEGNEIADEDPSPHAAMLQKFVGSWTTESQAVGADSIAPTAYVGTMEAKMLGQTWLVNQYDAKMQGTSFNAIQRLRFDDSTNKFVGTWVDSFMTHEWKLEGIVDGDRLVVNSEGPDPSDPTKTAQFRDIYKFESTELITGASEMKDADGNWQTFMTAKYRRANAAEKPDSSTQIMPFLMFEGKAEEAMSLYVSLFAGAKVTNIEKYGADGPGKEGTIKQARFKLAGQQVMCIDSPAPHAFTFTPSFSFFVECETEAQLDDLFAKLSNDGEVMMPPGNYGFSRKFCWTSDRFGVSWQLNLAGE